MAGPQHAALAEAGAHILVHYGRSAQDAESLVAAILSKGGRANAIRADLGTPEGATLLAKEVRTIVGERLDVLVLNAGISKAARFADYTVEDFDNLFATNVRSPFFLVQQLLPILGDGSNIIVISSIGARAVVGKPGVDNPSLLAYASTKGALETLVKNWAAILGPRGHSRECSRARRDRHGHVELCEDRSGSRGDIGNASAKTNRQAGRCRGRRRFPGVRRGPLDHGSQHPRRWRVEALRS